MPSSLSLTYLITNQLHPEAQTSPRTSLRVGCCRSAGVRIIRTRPWLNLRVQGMGTIQQCLHLTKPCCIFHRSTVSRCIREFTLPLEWCHQPTCRRPNNAKRVVSQARRDAWAFWLRMLAVPGIALPCAACAPHLDSCLPYLARPLSLELPRVLLTSTQQKA